MSNLSPRVTVAHGRHRKWAERQAAIEQFNHPEATNVRVTGKQGAWKVRRDRLPEDPVQINIRTEGAWSL